MKILALTALIYSASGLRIQNEFWNEALFEEDNAENVEKWANREVNLANSPNAEFNQGYFNQMKLAQ